MGKDLEKFVKFEGDNAIVWRHPAETIDENTTVMCPHTHEIVFIKEGAMLDSLRPGTHQLIEKEIKKGIFTKKDVKQFYCSLIYVNVSSTLKVLWGTPNRIELFDSKINVPVSVGLNGSFIIRIDNARKFITKVGGIDSKYTVEALQEFFRGMMLLYIKDSLANAMVVEKISFYEIWTNMRKITSSIKKDLEPKFMDYGVELCEFAIENILIPDDVKLLVEKTYKEKFELETKGLSFERVYNDQKEKEAAERELVKEAIKAKSDENLIECEYCKEKIGENDNFCWNCGKSVNIDIFICEECEFEIINQLHYCPNCGTKLKKEECIDGDLQ